MEAVTLIEGSLATQLVKYVGDTVDGHPLWNARFIKTDPEKCIAVHRDYLKTGVEIITTETYQASVDGFMKHMGVTKDEAVALIKESVKIAKEAVKRETEATGSKRNVKIASMVGPYGAYLHDGSEYNGSYKDKITKQELINWHRSRFEALVDEGVDIIGFYTMPFLKEAEAVLSLLAEKPEQKAWICFHCKDDKSISSGELFFDVVKKCWELGGSQLIAIGVNCVRPEFVTPLFTGIRKELPQIPLLALPNSGEVFDVKSGRWRDGESTRSLEDYIEEWLDLGVRYIGGCCRTNEHDIKRFFEKIQLWKHKKGLLK